MVAQALATSAAGKLRTTISPIFRDMDTELAASPVSIDCRSGCHYCCHYHVTVSAAEAFAIAEHLLAMPGAAGTPLLARLAATAKHVAPLTEEQYLVTNIPYAFLDGGRCSIYEVRPIACRGHHAVWSDVCQRTFEDPNSGEQSTMDATRREVHVGYKSALQFGEHLAGRLPIGTWQDVAGGCGPSVGVSPCQAQGRHQHRSCAADSFGKKPSADGHFEPSARMYLRPSSARVRKYQPTKRGTFSGTNGSARNRGSRSLCFGSVSTGTKAPFPIVLI